MPEFRPSLLTVLGSCPLACLGVILVTGMAGCGDTAGARPKQTVSQVARPGRAARPSPPTSVPAEARPATAESPAAFASRHQPYVEGECQTCHGNDKSGALRPDFMTVCRDCHEPLFAYHRFGHAPTVVGACRFCHAMHASQHEALLWAPQTELCLKCHPTQEDQGSSSGCQRLAEAKVCTACHDPHSAEKQLLLEPGEVRRPARPAPTRGSPPGARG